MHLTRLALFSLALCCAALPWLAHGSEAATPKTNLNADSGPRHNPSPWMEPKFSVTIVQPAMAQAATGTARLRLP